MRLDASQIFALPPSFFCACLFLLVEFRFFHYNVRSHAKRHTNFDQQTKDLPCWIGWQIILGKRHGNLTLLVSVTSVWMRERSKTIHAILVHAHVLKLQYIQARMKLCMSRPCAASRTSCISAKVFGMRLLHGKLANAHKHICSRHSLLC